MSGTMNKIVKFRDFLRGRLDPDILLDCLLSNAVLSKKEVDEVKSRSTIWRKNERLLDQIIEQDDEEEFVNALRTTNQQHLANYVIYDGELPKDLKPVCNNQDILLVWPLEETKIKIIDANIGSLKDLLDMGYDLIDKLLARRVINHRQQQLICSKATDSEMAEAFLDTLRRGSNCDYEHTIQCLRDSNQGHIADILEKGGVVLPVHAVLQDASAEVRIVEKITNLLHGTAIDDVDRILEMVRDNVIGVKIGHSIVFYYYFETLQSWQELKNAMKAGMLKRNIEELCRRAGQQTRVLIAEIYIKDYDLENVDIYFDNKVDLLTRMKVVKRENVVVELKAEAISSQDDVKDATKRQQLNESKRESNKDEMDVNQQTDEEEQVYTGMMTRSRCKRMRLANVKEDNSVFQSEAEAISKAPVTSERRRIEQPIEMPNKDELDFSQPKKEEKTSFFF